MDPFQVSVEAGPCFGDVTAVFAAQLSVDTDVVVFDASQSVGTPPVDCYMAFGHWNELKFIGQYYKTKLASI